MLKDDSSAYDPVKHKHIFAWSNTTLIVALIIACMFECGLVLNLWIRPHGPVDPQIAFIVQFMVLGPAIAIVFLRFMIGKQLRKGGISPAFASGLSSNLSLLLMIVYLAFMQLLTLAAR